MDNSLQVTLQTRKNFLRLLDSLTIEQLNEIPDGFNNNIAWNAAHIIVAQQSLCYGLAGASLKIDKSMIEKYGKGTKPTSFIGEEEMALLKKLMVSSISDLEKDLQTNIFANYQTYQTSFGFELTNIQDTIKFFPIHDALHFGYAMALKRMVTKN